MCFSFPYLPEYLELIMYTTERFISCTFYECKTAFKLCRVSFFTGRTMPYSIGYD